MKSKDISTAVKEFRDLSKNHYRRLQLIVLTDLIAEAERQGYRVTGLDFEQDHEDEYGVIQGGTISIPNLLDDWLNDYEDTWLLFSSPVTDNPRVGIRFISLPLGGLDGWICDWSNHPQFSSIVQAAQDQWIGAVTASAKATYA